MIGLYYQIALHRISFYTNNNKVKLRVNYKNYSCLEELYLLNMEKNAILR